MSWAGRLSSVRAAADASFPSTKAPARGVPDTSRGVRGRSRPSAAVVRVAGVREVFVCKAGEPPPDVRRLRSRAACEAEDSRPGAPIRGVPVRHAAACVLRPGQAAILGSFREWGDQSADQACICILRVFPRGAVVCDVSGRGAKDGRAGCASLRVFAGRRRIPQARRPRRTAADEGAAEERHAHSPRRANHPPNSLPAPPVEAPRLAARVTRSGAFAPPSPLG